MIIIIIEYDQMRDYQDAELSLLFVTQTEALILISSQN